MLGRKIHDFYALHIMLNDKIFHTKRISIWMFNTIRSVRKNLSQPNLERVNVVSYRFEFPSVNIRVFSCLHKGVS